MEYTIKERKESNILFECRNSGEELEKSRFKAYEKISKDIKIPGFRKGKAPYEIGVRYIGEEQLLEEALDILIREDLEEILKKENIVPVTSPDIKVEKVDKDGLLFTVIVEFLPEVHTDLSKNIKINGKVEVKEEEIDGKLKELQDSLTELSPIDTEIEVGDVVEVSFVHGEDEPQTLTVEAGTDRVIGDFKEKIIGKKRGDSFVVNTNSQEFTFTVLSVKRKYVPPVDDNLAKEAGFENLEELRAKISRQIVENKNSQLEENRGKEALKVLCQNLKIELPSKFVEEEVDFRVKKLEEEYLKSGKKLEDVLKDQNYSINDLKNDLRKRIGEEIKEDLIVADIIREKNIQVSEEEIREEFEHLIAEQSIEAGRVGLTEELRRAIRNELLRSKAISILKENAIIETGGD